MELVWKRGKQDKGGGFVDIFLRRHCRPQNNEWLCDESLGKRQNEQDSVAKQLPRGYRALGTNCTCVKFA